MDEPHFLEIMVESIPKSSSPLSSKPSLSSQNPPLERNLNLEGNVENQNVNEILVYSRRPKSRYEELITTEAPREAELVISPNRPDNSKHSDLDLPIALIKQKRPCTLHPISKFLS